MVRREKNSFLLHFMRMCFVFFSIILHWLLLATRHHTFSLRKSAYCCTMIYAKDMSSSNGYCLHDVKSNCEAEEETAAATAPQLLMMKKMSTWIECGCQHTCFGRLISTINFLITQSCSIILIYRWCWHASSMAQLAGFIRNLCFHTCTSCYWATECVDSLVGWLVCVAQKFMRVPRNQLCAPIYHAHELQMNERKKCTLYALCIEQWFLEMLRQHTLVNHFNLFSFIGFVCVWCRQRQWHQLVPCCKQYADNLSQIQIWVWP